MKQIKYIYTLAFLISLTCYGQTGHEYVIKFKSHLQQDEITSLIRGNTQIKNWRFLTPIKHHPLSGIVKITSHDFKPTYWTNTNVIEYIEQLPETFFSTDTLPSDPYYPFQWEHSFVNSAQAWNLLSTNDSNFLVGIVDSGSDFDHEDLKHFHINPNDPINGVDDDNNGLIDDYRGWDFGEYDNDPSIVNALPHGREMTSLVAAHTNNGIGMSAMSYNVKYITAKISSDMGQIFDPYEGITYVVDQGAKVVNCSWYQNVSTKYAQDVIDYALSKNALVVASAGNDNSDQMVYPASYSNVIGVGAIDNTGLKTSVSNYGDWVDIFAPGKDIYVAYPNNTYFTTGGTSVSCALVSSACSLLRKLFPNENPTQIITRIKRSGQPITNTNISGKYLNLFGAAQSEVITDFKIFPNPSKDGTVSIDLPFAKNNTPILIEVYNVLGRLMYRQKIVFRKWGKNIQYSI